MSPRISPVDRRRFLTLMGLSAGAVVGSQAIIAPAEATTWRLHDDTSLVGLGNLYSGSLNNSGCDTAASSDCPGPGNMSAYWGGLYVNSTVENRLRTGPFTSCDAPFPGTGNTDRMRWASSLSWEPEYSFTGRILVNDISPNRPEVFTGLVFHPVHISNCDNYYVRIWERSEDILTFAREVNDAETILKRVPFSQPALGAWHDYRVEVLPGSRIRFIWNGQLVLDEVDPAQAFSGGPVGMRLDYFDTVLDETRVVKP